MIHGYTCISPHHMTLLYHIVHIVSRRVSYYCQSNDDGASWWLFWPNGVLFIFWNGSFFVLRCVLCSVSCLTLLHWMSSVLSWNIYLLYCTPEYDGKFGIDFFISFFSLLVAVYYIMVRKTLEGFLLSISLHKVFPNKHKRKISPLGT